MPVSTSGAGRESTELGGLQVPQVMGHQQWPWVRYRIMAEVPNMGWHVLGSKKGDGSSRAEVGGNHN